MYLNFFEIQVCILRKLDNFYEIILPKKDIARFLLHIVKLLIEGELTLFDFVHNTLKITSAPNERQNYLLGCNCRALKC